MSVLHSNEVVDETWYLITYNDVHQAVRAGLFVSGQQHYDLHGREERRRPNATFTDAMSAEERQTRVGAVWSNEPGPGWYWMAHPAVQARVNRLASGDPGHDAYAHFADFWRVRGGTLPIPRAISLGCGFGGLERNLAGSGIVDEIDAYDIAPGAIAEAKRLAKKAGMAGLHYHLCDLEQAQFEPSSVDAVFAHSSVHHIERLEAFFEMVADMLRPGGLFHINEFVGPDRFQWTDAQIAGVNRFLDSLPARLRQLPSGRPRPNQERPSIAAVIAADPSEAVRSSAIIPLMKQHFEILEERSLGGALLHLGLAEIAQNFDPKSSEDQAMLQKFFDEEDELMRTGEIESDFAVIIATKKS